jgi:membrane-associated protease RseP (regulator of RpoE activity)
LIVGIQLLAADRAAAQRVPDPAPLGDDEQFGGDLPAPPLVAPGTAHSTRPFLGVTFDPRSRNAAVVRSVTPGGPADLSGIVAGDTIVSLNGRRIGSYEDVLQAVTAMRPGDVMNVEVKRLVKVQAQVVLNAQSTASQPTTAYRVEAEPLPAPAGYQQPPQTIRPSAPSDARRARQNDNRTQGRTDNVDRDDDDEADDDRGNRFRGRFWRRRG